VGKRDPFRSYLAEAERAAAQGQREKKREATEEFELDQYRLTALITGTAQPKAMVEDPQGKGHTLRIGSRLGRNGGRVTRITSLGITVTEEIRTPTGERVRVPIQILLPRPEQDLRIEP
jgi:type IV pilus assembly protein PilP